MRPYKANAVEFDSLPKIIRQIPENCFDKSLLRSCLYLVLDFALLAALAYLIVRTDSWLLTLLSAVLMGHVLTGAFVIGHDCGHRSFCKSEKLNNFFGHLTTTLTLWPFHVWRLSHDIHHQHTHNIERDIAWRPYSLEKFRRIAKITRAIYLQTRSNFFFIGSIFFTIYFVKDALRGRKSRHFFADELKQLRFSLWLTAGFTLLYLILVIHFAGFRGFVGLFLVPQFVFHFYLSTFTLFHHTSPDTRFMTADEWTASKAQLGCSVHVSYPRPIEWLCHDINWHVPHHVCVGIPHYRLRKAHQALKQAYPSIVQEQRFNLALIKSVTRKCHFVGSHEAGGLWWVNSDEAKDMVAAPATTR